MDFLINVFKRNKQNQEAEIIPRITARVIIEQEGKYLFLLQTDERGGRLSLPGGGIKTKEPVRKGLIREVREETNLIISKKDLVLMHTHYKKKKRELEVVLFFKVTINDFAKLKLNEPHKFVHFIWYSKDYIPKNMIRECRTALKKISKGVIFSERKKKKHKKNSLKRETVRVNEKAISIFLNEKITAYRQIISAWT